MIKALRLSLFLSAAIVPAVAWGANLKTEVVAASVQLGEFCSGSVIYSRRGDDDKNPNHAKTLVLTAKHCVDDKKQVDIRVATYDDRNAITGYTLYTADVTLTYFKEDLALLELRDKERVFNTIKICSGDKEPAMGDPVTAVGFPLGFAQTITTGFFGGRESIPFPNESKMTEYYRSSAQIMNGSSGGILAWEEDGAYCQIGVASAIVPQANFMTWNATLDQIHDFLKLAKVVNVKPADADDDEETAVDNALDEGGN